MYKLPFPGCALFGARISSRSRRRDCYLVILPLGGQVCNEVQSKCIDFAPASESSPYSKASSRDYDMQIDNGRLRLKPQGNQVWLNSSHLTVLSRPFGRKKLAAAVVAIRVIQVPLAVVGDYLNVVSITIRVRCEWCVPTRGPCLFQNTQELFQNQN